MRRAGSLSKNNGFTLLEMALVLVIIGIITGGIAITQSMVRAAEIRSVISEYGSYTQAIKEFQDKYSALPGDMSNAVTYWGTDAAGCPAGGSTPTVATCNGDGNGHIGDSNTAGSLGDQGEWWRAWQHLANANLIDSQFTGGGGNVADADIGLNVPASRLKPAGWTILYYLQNATDANMWGDDYYGHILAFGTERSGAHTTGGALKPEDALNIDSKIDDGRPGTGKIRAWREGVLDDCASDASQAGAEYASLQTGMNCALIFILGF